MSDITFDEAVEAIRWHMIYEGERLTKKHGLVKCIEVAVRRDNVMWLVHYGDEIEASFGSPDGAAGRAALNVAKKKFEADWTAKEGAA